MPRQYPTGFRDEMVGRMLGGESVSGLVLESGMPMQTLHRWKHQALIDACLAEGIDSTESAALRAARSELSPLSRNCNS